MCFGFNSLLIIFTYDGFNKREEFTFRVRMSSFTNSWSVTLRLAFTQQENVVEEITPSLYLIRHLGPFNLYGLTLIPAWISIHMGCKMGDEITYPFPNFKGCSDEVWDWISNFITTIYNWCYHLSIAGYKLTDVNKMVSWGRSFADYMGCYAVLIPLESSESFAESSHTILLTGTTFSQRS